MAAAKKSFSAGRGFADGKAETIANIKNIGAY